MVKEKKHVEEIGLISREPVLAEILASRKPLLMGEEGYYWLVSWIADIGSTIRSRENIAGLIVSITDSALLNALLSLIAVTSVGSVIVRLLGVNR